MCLSTVFQVVDGKPEQVASQESNAEVGDGCVTFTDILGAETTVEGSISSVDLIENRIYVTV